MRKAKLRNRSVPVFQFKILVKYFKHPNVIKCYLIAYKCWRMSEQVQHYFIAKNLVNLFEFSHPHMQIGAARHTN